MLMKRALAAVFVSLCSCVGPSDIVRARMAEERNCSPDAITVHPLPGGTFRAEGCGSTETFVCTVQGGTTQSCIKESVTQTPESSRK